MSEAILTFVLVLTTFACFLLGSLIVRRRRTPLSLRPIEAYRLIPLEIDASLEADRKVHFSFGSAAVGGESTPVALAGADLMYFLFLRLAFQPKLPLISLSDPLTLAVASDTLRKAYLKRDNLKAFKSDSIAWYPQGETPLTFAALASHTADLDVSNHLLFGQFGPELAFLSESATRRQQNFYAVSTTLEGQAIAYATSAQPIIGEEIFQFGAYTQPQSGLYMGGLVAMDTLRWFIIIFGILLSVLVNALD
jgi:hypothetical protein